MALEGGGTCPWCPPASATYDTHTHTHTHTHTNAHTPSHTVGDSYLVDLKINITHENIAYSHLHVPEIRATRKDLTMVIYSWSQLYTLS